MLEGGSALGPCRTSGSRKTSNAQVAAARAGEHNRAGDRLTLRPWAIFVFICSHTRVSLADGFFLNAMNISEGGETTHENLMPYPYSGRNCQDIQTIGVWHIDRPPRVFECKRWLQQSTFATWSRRSAGLVGSTFELLTLTVAASIALLQNRTKKAEHAILSAEVDTKSTPGLSVCGE